MDYQTPPLTSALQNLTITDLVIPPTTSLQNHGSSDTDSDSDSDESLSSPTSVLRNRPITYSLPPPTRVLVGFQNRGSSNNTGTIKPRKRFDIRAFLNFLLQQWYGTSKIPRSSIRLEDPSYIVPPKERLNQLRLRLRAWAKERESMNSLSLSYILRRITGILNDMAENRPEHTEKLELAKLYIQQRVKKQDVLSIIESVYTDYSSTD